MIIFGYGEEFNELVDVTFCVLRYLHCAFFSGSVTIEDPSAVNYAEYTQVLECPANISLHSPVAGFQTLGVRTIEDP